MRFIFVVILFVQSFSTQAFVTVWAKPAKLSFHTCQIIELSDQQKSQEVIQLFLDYALINRLEFKEESNVKRIVWQNPLLINSSNHKAPESGVWIKNIQSEFVSFVKVKTIFPYYIKKNSASVIDLRFKGEYAVNKYYFSSNIIDERVSELDELWKQINQDYSSMSCIEFESRNLPKFQELMSFKQRKKALLKEKRNTFKTR